MTFFPIQPCCLQVGTELPGTPRGTYHPVDSTHTVGRYIVQPTNPAPGKERTGVIVFPDAFCFNLPNPKLAADALADKLGLTVYASEYIRESRLTYTGSGSLCSSWDLRGQPLSLSRSTDSRSSLYGFAPRLRSLPPFTLLSRSFLYLIIPKRPATSHYRPVSRANSPYSSSSHELRGLGCGRRRVPGPKRQQGIPCHHLGSLLRHLQCHHVHPRDTQWSCVPDGS